MEDDHGNKMEDNLPKNGRRPQKIKWKTNQSTKINLIGYDTIVNSPSSTIVVVNNVLGKTFPNPRCSLRQGDVPSMFWFAIGIDPSLYILKKD